MATPKYSVLCGRTLGCLLLWSLCLVTSASHADEKKRVAVLDFEGPLGGAVRGHVLAALAEHKDACELVPAKEVEQTAQRLHVRLANDEGLVKVAAALGLSAVIDGRAGKGGRGVRAVAVVRNGADGQTLQEEVWTRKNKGQLRDIRDNFWTVMGNQILTSSAPPAAEPEPAPQEELTPVAPPSQQTVEEPPPEPTRAAAAPESSEASAKQALVALIGPRLMWRELRYDDDPGSLSGYENNSPAFNLALSAQWFALAHIRSDVLANFGVDVAVDYTIGLKSKENGKDRSTTAYDLLAGLVYRHPLDTFEPNLRVGWFQQTFDVNTKVEPLPRAAYRGVRIGAGTLIHVYGPFSFDLGAAYLVVLDAGDFSDSKIWSSSSARGVEALAGLDLDLTDRFGMRLGIEFRRYSMDLKEQPGQTFGPAGVPLPEGATDSYLRSTLSLVYSMPGQASD